MDITDAIDRIGHTMDLAGVATMGVGTVLIAAVVAVRRVAGTRSMEQTYRDFRSGIGRSILLGLELLVAADIIRTVAVRPTFQSVGVLAAIILIRTFLSFTLEVEISGRWPWQRHSEPTEVGRAHVSEPRA